MKEFLPAVCVIVISGTSGAGKTSLVSSVAHTLRGAALHFDDYASTATFPTDLAAWVRDGADPNAWRTPQMASDLLALRSGRPIQLPGSDEVIEPKPFLIVEEPFGRARRELSDLVDFCAFLNVPLETALARKLLRDLSASSLRSDLSRSREYVTDFLGRYLDSIRDVYRAANQCAAQNCDMVLDGEKSLEELTQEMVNAARQRADSAASRQEELRCVAFTQEA